MPGQVLSMEELGWQLRRANAEARQTGAEGMGAYAAFKLCGAGRFLGLALKRERIAIAKLNLEEALLVVRVSLDE